ncbi:MAG: hypothetical protein V7609_1458 [Verrucomicrobiota bacterium]
MKVAALRTLELICFIGALVCFIPPIFKDQQPYYRPIIGVSLFAVSLLLSWRRAAEHWITGIVKFVVYLFLMWIVYQRMSFQ